MAEQRDPGDECTGDGKVTALFPYDPATWITSEEPHKMAREIYFERTNEIFTLLMERDNLRSILSDATQGQELVEAKLFLDARVATGKNEKERGALHAIVCHENKEWRQYNAAIASRSSDLNVIEAGLERARDMRSLAKRTMDYCAATRLLEAYARK